MKKIKRILCGIFASCICASFTAGMNMTSGAEPEDSTYTIVIPAALDVSDGGYTPVTGGIKASGNISGKLTLSASSENSWNLQDIYNSSNIVPYKLTSSTDSTDLKDSWEFSADDIAAEKTEEVYVYVSEEDYDNAEIGTYQDTIIFTASVVSPKILSGMFISGAVTSVYFKWEDADQGDYISAVYDGALFNASIGGEGFAVKEEANFEAVTDGNKLVLKVGLEDFHDEGIIFTLDADTDTYNVVYGNGLQGQDEGYELLSVKLNGADITDRLIRAG